MQQDHGCHTHLHLAEGALVLHVGHHGVQAGIGCYLLQEESTPVVTPQGGGGREEGGRLLEDEAEGEEVKVGAEVVFGEGFAKVELALVEVISLHSSD